MKRNHIRYMLLLLPVLLLAGCQDPMDDHGPDAPDGPTTFTATIGSAATKTLLAGQPGGERPVYWAADDSVCIGGAIYRVSRITATDSTQAIFSGSGAAKGTDGKYEAFYPASLYDNRTLPAVQKYGAINSVTKRTNIAHLPMYAKSDNTALTFHNLCTVLNVRLTGGNSVKVDSVVVTSALNRLNGPFDVVADAPGFKAQMSGTATDARKKVTLDCGTGVALSPDKATEFLVAIPAGDYPQYDLTIKVYNGSTEIASFTNLDASGTVLNRSEILDLKKSTTTTFRVRKSASADTLTLPFRNGATWPSEVVVAWGDGKTDTLAAGTPARIGHTYTAAADGDYVVTITVHGVDAMIPQVVWNDELRKMLTEWMSPLPRMNTTEVPQMFLRCTSLTTIHPDLFINNPQLTNFQHAFRECSSLTAIPETLFAPCQEATNFFCTFYGCSSLLSPIPENLFAENTKVTTFHGTFYECSSLRGPLPPKLFEKNTEVTTFRETFYGCSSLTGEIPGNLFKENKKVTTFLSVFENCSGLTGDIKALFDGHTEAENFSFAFKGCSGLDGSISEALFNNCAAVTTFQETFHNCSSLKGPIPEKLFEDCPEVVSFFSTFSGCYQMTDTIPGKLFANNTKVGDFRYLFNNNYNLTGRIPGNLFANNKMVEDFTQTFYGCRGLSGSLTDTLFKHNTEVKNFSKTFALCRNLEGEIPAGFFMHNEKAWKFADTFNGCRNLRFNSDVFVNPTWTKPYTRFATEGVEFDFRGCFSYVSADLDVSDNPVGSVPPLWDSTQYTLSQETKALINKNYTTDKNRTPFQGIHASEFYSIPEPWRATLGTPDA